MPYERKTSDIYTTQEFRNILKIFADKSTYAKLLLKKRINKDMLQDDHINYFDISKSDMSKISYLTKDRIDLISQSEEDDFWSTSRRYKGKPGAFINKIFKDVPNKEVENFATLWKTFSLEKAFNFKVVEGEDVRKYYSEDHHHKCSGSLENSCMKYDKCQKYLDIYVDNGVKMLVMFFKETDEILGRALLWETIDGKKVMDRIYTVYDEEYLNHFIKWADDNDYYYKTKQNWFQAIQFTKKGKSDEFKFEIKLNNSDYKYYPYLDTFKFLDKNSGTISNFCQDHDNTDKYICLSSPGGGYESANYLRLDEISREYCYSGDLICVTNSNGETIWTDSDNCSWSDLYDKWILSSESTYSEELESNIYLDDERNDKDLMKERLAFIKKRRKESKKATDEISKILSGGGIRGTYQFIMDTYNSSLSIRENTENLEISE